MSEIVIILSLIFLGVLFVVWIWAATRFCKLTKEDQEMNKKMEDSLHKFITLSNELDRNLRKLTVLQDAMYKDVKKLRDSYPPYDLDPGRGDA